MKRLNIQASFIGESNPSVEGLETGSSDDAVLLRVHCGELVLVVPPSTPDDCLLEGACYVRGTLHLENERVLTFEIHQGAIGAYFEDEPAALHRRKTAQSSSDLFVGGTPFFI